MQINDMTTDQIKASIFVHDETRRNYLETRAKLEKAGVDEEFIRMLDMSSRSYEWAELLDAELKRREELDEVANLIYLNMFTTPTSSDIVPLKDHHREWERNMIYRQAEAVVGYYRTKNEPLAQWEIDLLESGKDEK